MITITKVSIQVHPQGALSQKKLTKKIFTETIVNSDGSFALRLQSSNPILLDWQLRTWKFGCLYAKIHSIITFKLCKLGNSIREITLHKK